MEKKKNSKHYIIPASYFKKKGITPVPVNVPKTETQEEKQVATPVNAQKTNQYSNSETPKIVLKQSGKRTSGLSLSSIRAKKEHLIKQMDVVVDEEDLPTEAFDPDDLIAHWHKFTDILIKQGKHNLASILSMDVPKVKGTTIHLEYPNATNKVELERQQYDLMNYLRKSVSNYDISLSITINEVLEKQYAYTPADKFEKLKEKNPNLELLRKTFDLDII